MATGATGQLGLALPVQGELSGTWGDTVNNGITQYTNIAIAGTLTLTGDGAVTLQNTTGDASASNIVSTLTGAGTVTAQFAIVRVTGTLTTAKVVTAPSYSKTYLVVNAATGSTVSFIRSGQTPAISIAVGESALVYFNGTDYVKVAGTTSGAAAGSNTQVQFNSSGVLAGSANMTFDGTNLTVGGSATATRFIPSGSTVATNGMYLPAANTLGFSTNSTEAIRIDSVGAVGIGGTAPAGTNVLIAKNITGAVTGQAVRVTSQIQADVTSEARAFISLLSTAASAPVGNVQHFFAGQGSLGAGSTISQQVGFNAASTLTGATNNYGFYGAIASGTGRYNLYMNGTADNYLAGALQIGPTAYNGTTLAISKNITGDVFGLAVRSTGQIQSDVTTEVRMYDTNPSTVASAFTLASLSHFKASQGTFGAGSTVTNQFGFSIESSLTGATNNYGIHSNIASGSNRWNFYAAGTAQNYFAGNVGIATTSPGSALDVKGTLRLSGSTSGYVGLAPAAAAGSTTYTLPSADGTSGQLLSTNGSGTLSWATGGGGGSAATPTALGTVYGTLSNTSSAFTGIGYEALNSNTGTENTAIGYRASKNNTSGGTNVSVGAYASLTNSTGAANTAIGYQAAYYNTASNNTAVGCFALPSNTTTPNNTAVGYQSLYSQVNPTYGNTAVGHQALYTNTTGFWNTALGGTIDGYWNAPLYANTSGSYNVALGYGAMQANTTGSDNVGVGNESLRTNTTGGSNVAIGKYALNANTTASGNTAIGYETAYTNTTGIQITALGYRAAKAGTTANYITAIGYAALLTNTTGGDNVAVGASAMELNTTGGDNTAVGDAALYANTTGAQNVSVGRNAGNSITTGSQNVCVGYDTDAGAVGGLGQITIGYGLAGQGNYHVTMGTSSSKIYVNYTSTGTWTQTSDASLKNVIGQETLGLSFINRLNPVTFTWKSQTDLPVTHPHYSTTNKKNVTTVMHGLLAQDVKAAMDAEGCATFNGWDQGPDGVQAVSREMFVTPLIKAIQELSAQVESLKARLDAANL